MKILDTLLEIKEHIPVSGSDIVRDTNNPNYAKLIKAWGRGTYDNKVETFYYQISELLDKEKIK